MCKIPCSVVRCFFSNYFVHSIYESIQKEKIRAGDVIYIEANSGAVKRVGRYDQYATEADLEVI